VDDKIGLEVEYPEYSVEVGSESSMILPFDEPKYPLNIPTATDLSQAPYDARLIERDLPPVTAVSGQPAPKVIYSPYTYLWLMREANQTISNAVAQAIVVGLDTALTQRGWTINTLRVHEDYIYLHGQMPDDRPANDIIAELKRLSAEIAVNKDERLNAETLWADSYLALYPGRELEIDEVKRFLDFGRAG
jgi:REP element-mobilizing transposase RayT